MSMEYPGFELTDDEWLARVKDPQMPDPPQQPYNEAPSLFDTLSSGYDLLGTTDSFNLDIRDYPDFDATVPVEEPDDGQCKNREHLLIRRLLILEGYVKGMNSALSEWLNRLLNNASAQGAEMERGQNVEQVERSAKTVTNSDHLAIDSNIGEADTREVTNSGRFRLYSNIRLFNSDPRVQSFCVPSLDDETRLKISNWDAPSFRLGRGIELARHLVNQAGMCQFSARKDVTYDQHEMNARKNWRHLLSVVAQGISLFLDKRESWSRQNTEGKAAAIKFLETKVEETGLCKDHAKAVALYAYRLSRKEGLREETFVPSMLGDTETVKRKQEIHSSETGGDIQVTKKPRTLASGES